MLTYIVKRLFEMIPMLIGITLISFIVVNLAPGNPAQFLSSMNPKISETAYQKFINMYQLDKPVLERYWIWLKKLSRLDFGNSFASDQKPVLSKIAERLPVTIYLNLVSMILIIIISIPIGVLSAVYRNSLFDRITTVIVYIGFAVPTFWLAILCAYYFGVIKGWLPISGLTSYEFEDFSTLEKIYDVIWHSILPVGISVFGSIAGFSRFIKSSMMDAINEDYITAAYARGLSKNTVIFKHALRNALLPVITILGLSIPGLIGGSVIFESVFSIPGMGQLFYQSVMMRDYPVIMGILVIGSFLTLLGNLIADISYAIADPRIRYGKKK
ncbi:MULTISPECIES: ABC transporter permease [Calditerrivibrio]|uniref:Diguanylate cyclase n=1 Tax=Calditerrivibrio nitroreducens TaxID=477976 RepID=A0A2J6WMG3_9BACT|nr:MAG: diguanylate cyclase [Calditerrivibrio nitroreducens]